MREKVFTTKELSKLLNISIRLLKHWALQGPMEVEKLPTKKGEITAPLLFRDKSATYMAVLKELRIRGYSMQELSKENKNFHTSTLGEIKTSIQKAIALVITDTPVISLYDLNLLIIDGKSIILTTGGKGVFTEKSVITGISFDNLRTKYLGGNV